MCKKIPTLSRQKLFNDGKKKECGRCHKIKEHKFFIKRQGKCIRSNCEECRNELNAIRNFKKHVEIIKTIFDGKCNICQKGLEFLPAMEFHHLNPKVKKNTWRDLRAKNINQIITILKKENTQNLCKNCHSLQSFSNFEKFKDIILSEKLSINNLTKIDNHVYNELKSNPKYRLEGLKGAQHRARIKYRIKKWIKKKLIIDKVFGGKCIGCKQINSRDNLPLLEFHHRKPDKKEIKWENISKLQLEKIEDIIRNEDCICLCKNCHALIHSLHFEPFSVEIFGENSQFIEIINKKLKELRNSINTYKFDNLSHFK